MGTIITVNSCGCTTTVERCSKHSNAERLYKVLRDLAADPQDQKALTDARQVLDDVERGP